ncbi:host nuclease inhibitor protein [Metapseudomonas sp. CR1201]
MSAENTISVESIMSQAQVFASAWSLIDGPFDSGNALENAEEAKEELREMLEQFCSQVELKEIAEGLIRWHTSRMNNIKTILDAPAGTEIRLGEDDPLVLQDDKAKGFRIGLAIAQQWFGNFPLSIDRSGDEDDEG